MAESIQRGSEDVLRVDWEQPHPAQQRMFIKGWVNAECAPRRATDGPLLPAQ
jgi:hypothetical protein